MITNLKEAGAVLLGKLNLSEFARGGNFYHPAGTPHNPWNLDYNPGFSSSGSGARRLPFCALHPWERILAALRGFQRHSAALWVSGHPGVELADSECCR